MAPPPSVRPTPESDFQLPEFRHILVAVDDAHGSSFALRHAVATALRERAQLTLVRVVAPPPASAGLAGIAPDRLRTEMDAEAGRELRRLVDALPGDLSVTTVIRHGEPAEEILSLLREQSFDLVCLGSRGRGRVASAVLGSVSAAVLHASPVPVAVFHLPAHGGTAGG